MVPFLILLYISHIVGVYIPQKVRGVFFQLHGLVRNSVKTLPFQIVLVNFSSLGQGWAVGQSLSELLPHLAKL